jgi:hypothetical protein
VELPAALAPLALHVPHHAEQLLHVLIQKFVVVLDHSFQIFHALPHHPHGLETLIDRCVELRDGVIASRITQRMHPKMVDIARVSDIIVVAVVIIATAVRAFRSLLLGHIFPII